MRPGNQRSACSRGHTGYAVIMERREGNDGTDSPRIGKLAYRRKLQTAATVFGVVRKLL